MGGELCLPEVALQLVGWGTRIDGGHFDRNGGQGRDATSR